MALSINYPIDAYEIFGVRRLSPGHPVYLLSGPDLSKLVVKQEMVGFQAGKKEAMRHNLELMHAVDTDARIVVLTHGEVQALNDFVQHETTIATTLGNAVSVDVQNMSLALQGGGKWVKMGVKRLMKLDEAAQDRIAGNKAGVRQFAAAMNAPGGLEKLGEILAVDLFNDNNDRFSVLGGGWFNGTTLNFLINVGNVLLSSGHLSGLDSWDPNSPTGNARQPLNNLDPNQQWGGYLLRPNGSVNNNGQVITQEVFAEGVIADLETILGPRSRKLPGARKQRLEKKAKARLRQGMASAVPKMRARLRGLATQRALPVLLQHKANALGWNPL